jgi:hypothetical protein
MLTRSPVEVPVFSITSGFADPQEVTHSPSCSDPQRLYAERLGETSRSLSEALQDIETAQPIQYQSLLSTILAIPLVDLQNGCPALTLPERNKVATGVAQ